MNAIAIGTIRSRLLGGFGAVIVLLAIAGLVGRQSLTSLSQRIESTLAATQREARLTADITSNVERELTAGRRYLEVPDTANRNAFRSFGWATHRMQKELSQTEGMSADDVALVAAIDVQLSALEDELTVAQPAGIAELRGVGGGPVEPELPEDDDDDRREEQQHERECCQFDCGAGDFHGLIVFSPIWRPQTYSVRSGCPSSKWLYGAIEAPVSATRVGDGQKSRVTF